MSLSVHVRRRRASPRVALRRAATYAALTLGAATMVTPFLWMLSTSLKASNQIFAWPPVILAIPPVWDNYTRVLLQFPIPRYALNTAKIALLVTLGQLITCSMAGYSFARLRFPGRNVLFLAYLATMMVPGQVTMIPNYIVMNKLGWVGGHTGLIVPALVSPFGTFLLRQFFLTFPAELEDAAKLDGCNPLLLYARILLPNSKPILATLGVMTFQGTWNDFQWPLIMIGSANMRTLQVGLSNLSSRYYTEWTRLMAGSVMTLIPIVVLFFFAQNSFVQSIKMTGLKG